MVRSLGFEDLGRELGKQVITCEGRHTYIYIYIYIYTHIYIYIYMYIYICIAASAKKETSISCGVYG